MKKSLYLTCIFSFLFNFGFSEPNSKGYTEVENKNSLTIETPSLRSREFAKIQLANGLQAYIISDPDTDKSAAALSVNVGSWSDPKEYPGMAHFLEHMLFMGNKAFPDENEYFQYIFDHGGIANAYTAPDRTVYMFSINNDSFDGALDRFSHFFIDPLFKESGVGRELHAVDQEHSKNIENDFRRSWEIFKETGNPEHPNFAFATGNAETLSGIPREALMTWYNENYSAAIMRLVVYSSKPMNELKESVTKDFSSVKGSFLPKMPEFATLTSDQQKGSIVYIKPIKDLKYLTMDWELPENIATDSETKSVELISYILKSGSENSLKELLKREQLIDDMGCDTFDISKQNKLLKLSFSLTKKGVSDVDKVIEIAFQAINALKENPLPAYLFNEMQIMAKLNYRYQSRENAFSFVSEKAHQLVDEALETFPQKTLTATEYSPKTVEQILQFMTPENCLYMVMAPTELTEVKTDKVEKNNGGEYAIKKVSPEFLRKWKNIPPTSHIGLAPPNPYIPTDLKLLYKDSTAEHIAVPTLISTNEYGKYYFWGDDRYMIPEVCFTISFKSPHIDGSANSLAYTDLYNMAFEQKLAPLLSTAQVAGLGASLDYKDLKLSLSVVGYSEKSTEFLQNLLGKMKLLAPSQAEFDTYKDLLLSSYDNAEKAMPYLQSGAFISNILYNDAPLSKEKAKALKNIKYADFLHFSNELFNQAFVESVLAGNLLKTEAEKIPEMVKTTLKSEVFPLANQAEKQLLILPNTDGPYMVVEHIEPMGNAAILAIEEGPFTFQNKAAQLILSKALQESFFTTLRSKQQTGYIAKSWPKEVENQLLQFFVVQSNTHQPDDLISRFELFLEGYIKDFSSEISDERFDLIRNNLIEEVKQPPTNLLEMTSQLYQLAFYKNANFYFNQELIGALGDMNYSTLKEKTIKFLSRQNGKRLAVLVEGRLPADQLFKYHQISSESLKEMGTYISSQF